VLAVLRLSGVAIAGLVPTELMQVALAGAVGYGTNFLAVQMLFKPKQRVTWLPLKWLWPQGLIPAKQDELAVVVGEEVATKLLTPSTIADEISRVIIEILDESEAIEDFSKAFVEILEEAVPGFLEQFSTDLFDAIEEFIVEGISNEVMREQLVDVLRNWMKDPVKVDAFAGVTLDFLYEHAEELIALLKKILRRYRKKGDQVRALGIDLAKSSKMLDWKKLQKALKDVLRQPRGKNWVIDFNGKLVDRLPNIMDRILDDAALGDLKQRVGNLIDPADPEVIENRLSPRVLNVVSGDRFRDYLRTVLIPEAKIYFESWMKDGHLEPFLKKINVRARVEEAAGSLGIDELEDMANRVGAYHFGAIQVLGFILGLFAGGLIVLVDA